MNIVAVILGGGEGSQLNPLTRDRAKPAVPIAGKYRLVDIPISNCINGNIRRIYLLTQFNSVSLHQHVQSTYQFDTFSRRSFVRILAAKQTPGAALWYTGTADAVRKTFSHFMDEDPDLIVVLSGDQLYRMDFQDVIKQHLEHKADVTITTKPVERSDAGDLGIMRVDESGRITEFAEKPGTGPELDKYRAPTYEEERYLASMGIYVFNTQALADLINNDDHRDFGRDVIPNAIEDYRVYSYVFDGFWRDIGTIGSFWETNLSLTNPLPEFSFYDANRPVYTRMRYLPPSKVNSCDMKRALLTEGCIISGQRISQSIIGIRAVVGEGSVIENSVIMGADYYNDDLKISKSPPLGIGRDCNIKNAIIDKNARIGDGCHITPDGKKDNTVTDKYTVRDSVVVIPKNTVIENGTRI